CLRHLPPRNSSFVIRNCPSSFILYPLPSSHLAAQVDALDDVLDRLLFDEDIADLELVDDLTDDFGARVLVAIEAQEVGKLVHALAGDAVGRDLAQAPDLSAVLQEKLHLVVP